MRKTDDPNRCEVVCVEHDLQCVRDQGHTEKRHWHPAGPPVLFPAHDWNGLKDHPKDADI